MSRSGVSSGGVDHGASFQALVRLGRVRWSWPGADRASIRTLEGHPGGRCTLVCDVVEALLSLRRDRPAIQHETPRARSRSRPNTMISLVTDVSPSPIRSLSQAALAWGFGNGSKTWPVTHRWCITMASFLASATIALRLPIRGTNCSAHCLRAVSVWDRR